MGILKVQNNFPLYGRECTCSLFFNNLAYGPRMKAMLLNLSFSQLWQLSFHQSFKSLFSVSLILAEIISPLIDIVNTSCVAENKDIRISKYGIVETIWNIASLYLNSYPILVTLNGCLLRANQLTFRTLVFSSVK